eukprot:m.125233 g.125233  ORF g.125233 m.125233 type:complete len:1039 (-) comp16648_c0_seq2:95-3211(-)
MIGTYTRAFGWDMLHISNLLLSLTLTPALGFPGFEVGGQIDLGYDCFVLDDVNGGLKRNDAANCIGASVYLGFNPVQPLDTYFAAEFYGLTVENIITTFAAKQDAAAILLALPRAVKESGFPALPNNMPNPSFSFAVNPLGKQVPGKYIPGGLAFEGQVNLLGFEAYALLQVNPLIGIRLKAEMSPINIGNGVFVLQRSSTDTRGPIADVEVKYGGIPVVDVFIKGYFKALGIKKEITIIVNDGGMLFSIRDRFLGLFDTELTFRASYGNPAQAEFEVTGILKSDFIDRIVNGVLELVGAETQASTAEVDALNAQLQTDADAVDGLKRQVSDADTKVVAEEAVVADLEALNAQYQKAFDLDGSHEQELNDNTAQLGAARTRLQTLKTRAQEKAAELSAAEAAYALTQQDISDLLEDPKIRAALQANRPGFSVFELHEAKFRVLLSLATGGEFEVSLDFTFFGSRVQLGFTVNFQDIGKTIKNFFDEIFSSQLLASLGVGYLELGEACPTHHACKNFGPATTAVACCAAGGDVTCQHKKADYLGVGWCPSECRACPPYLCSAGSCGQPGQNWPRLESQSCLFHTDCGGWGPEATAMACCGGTCQRKQRDWAGVGYCPNECRGCPAYISACSLGTCDSEPWPREIGDTCSLHTDCRGWGPGTTDVACCAGTCQQKKADWAGVGYCPHECLGCPAYIGECKPGTCGIQPWPRPVGRTCVLHTDCSGWGPGTTQNACCNGICATKKQDFAGVGYCPHECRGCPAYIGECLPGTCGVQPWPRPVGRTCVLHTDCAGWGSGATQNACCNGVCATKKRDWAGVGYCPHECRGCPAALCATNTCGTENWPRAIGDTCTVHTDCAGYGAGATAAACCGGKCASKKKDWAGVGYCPGDCYGCPSDVSGCYKGSCGAVNWPRRIGETCKRHTDCSGWGAGTRDNACCNGRCAQKVADWAGVGYCPHECAGAFGAAGGTCYSGVGNGGSCHIGQNCNSGNCCSGKCCGLRCCKGSCTKLKRDWANVCYCPHECRGGAFKGAGTCGSRSDC